MEISFQIADSGQIADILGMMEQFIKIVDTLMGIDRLIEEISGVE